MRKLYQILQKSILTLFTLTLFCFSFQAKANETVNAVKEKKTISVLKNRSNVDLGIFQQQKIVTGKVTEKDGIPLPGTAVIEKGTNNGTETDFDGNYSITLTGEKPVLQFISLGFVTKEIVVGEQLTINAILKQSDETLGEVVVTALGIKKERKALAYTVREVDSEGINRAADGNILTNLQGKVAGLNVTTSGGVGGNARLELRGPSSLVGDDKALWVVDGVPFSDEDTTDPTDLFGGLSNGGGLLDINPDDIESITVLNAGQASALYGTRGANGVILVTTKSGKNAKGLGISYTGSTTFSEVAYTLDLQNEYGQGNADPIQGNRAVYNPLSRVSWGPRFDGAVRPSWTGEDLPYQAASNLIDDFTQTGVNIRHSVAFAKGGEKGDFRASITKDKNEGVYDGNTIERLNFDLKTSYDINKWLNMDAKISHIRNQGQQRPEIGLYSFVTQLNQIPAGIRSQDLDPGFIIGNNFPREILFGPSTTLTDNPNPDNRNPYFVQSQTVNNDERNRMFGYLAGNVKFNENLSLKLKYSLDFYRYERINGFRFPDNADANRPEYNTSERFFREENSEFLFRYEKDLTEDLSLGASIGGNIMKRESNELTAKAIRISTPGDFFLGAGTSAPSTESFSSQEIQSLYSFVDLSYKNYLFLTATARNDWSSALASRFTDNQVSYFYPSVGLSALISEMAEMPSFVNYLKVRGSLAQLGKDTNAFLTNPSFEPSPSDFNLIGVELPDTSVNRNLEPEISTTVEAGLELKMFNNRLSLDASYYKEFTKNQILLVPSPQTIGFSEQVTNAGLITNEGVELVASFVPVKTANFDLGVTLNVAKNVSILEEYLTPEDNDEFHQFFNSNTIPEEVRAIEGEKMGDIFGFAYQRNPDGSIVVGADGLPVATQDIVKLGNIQADFTGSIGLDFNYKDFSLSTLFSYQVGGDIYSFTEAVATATGNSEKSISLGRDPFFVEGRLADDVTLDANGSITNITQGGPNLQIVSPEAYWGRVSGITEEFIYDASFMKLSEVSLSYRFPKKWLETIGNNYINDVKLSIVGRNLFYLYRDTPGTVPDAGVYNSTFGAQAFDFSPVPVTRSLGFALNLNF